MSLGWERWVGDEGAIIGLDHFGASAPAGTIFEKLRLHRRSRGATSPAASFASERPRPDPDARAGPPPPAPRRRPPDARRRASPASTARPARTRATADARLMRVAFAADHAGAGHEGRAAPPARRGGPRPRARRPRRRRLRPERRLPGLRPAARHGGPRRRGRARHPDLRLRRRGERRGEQDARRPGRRLPRHVLGPPGRRARRHERPDARRPGHRARARAGVRVAFLAATLQRRGAPPPPARQGPRHRGRRARLRPERLVPQRRLTVGRATMEARHSEDRRNGHGRWPDCSRSRSPWPTRRHHCATLQILGDATAGRFDGRRVGAGPARSTGPSGSSTATPTPLVDGSARPGRRSPSASAGSTRPAHFASQIAALEGFGEGIRDAGFTTAVVTGMGGSSLAPDVLVETFGSGEGWLDLRVLDSTDPAAVAATVDDLDPLATLLIVASKSGTTTEPLAFQADAWDRIEKALRSRHAPRNEHAGEFVVAITDPGKSLEAIPHHDELREVFLNPPDIGGRYSALTYVGLVPASLIGLDLDALLASATMMLGACREPDPTLESGRQPRAGHRRPRPGGPRQADVPGRSGDRELRGVGRAAHRREHRQAGPRHRARSTASRWARRPGTGRTASSSASTLATVPAGPEVSEADALDRCPRRSRAIR